MTASQAKIIELEDALKKQTRRMAEGSAVTPPPPPKLNRDGVWVSVALLLIATLVFRRLVAKLDTRVHEWANSSAMARSIVAEISADEMVLANLVTEFQNGPAKTAVSAEVAAVNAFLARSAELLVNLQSLLHKIRSGDNGNHRQQLLADFQRELRGFKGEAGLSELLPVWQTASALDGLIKQLSDHPEHISQSTLRTAAAGLDLLKELCQPGIRADLLSNPPLRLLAVDDDLISRKAVSFALKKALNQPDLAENGEKALAMATMQNYDVIFLDVQMPGMDGFELCTKIHETVPNATTPVVFVTCMSDFDSRARSVLSGGTDLIGKPFLTFEITVKALTLALHGRLRGSVQTAGERKRENVIAALPEPAVTEPDQIQSPSELSPCEDTVTTSGEQSPDGMIQAFLTRATTQVGALRDRIQAIFQATDENVRQEMLAEFYLRLNSLIPATDSAKGHPTLRMIAGLEGLLKKLLQNPKHCTSSTLFTLATGVDVLNELCAAGVKSDLATNPPIRLLVADDDPVARRAITGALQMAFEKPEEVDCGEAALASAKVNTFDVIFLDVQMPRMDGFTASARIRETSRNRTTPVVFVTGQSDFKSRTQANLSGGNDLIGKPFLTAEIRVKALTFALRGRLRKLRSGAHWHSLASDASVDEALSSENLSKRAAQRLDARRRARRFKTARQSWYKSA